MAKLQLVNEAGQNEGRRRFGTQDTLAKPDRDQPRAPCLLGLVQGKAALAPDNDRDRGIGLIRVRRSILPQDARKRKRAVSLVAKEGQISLGRPFDRLGKAHGRMHGGNNAAPALLSGLKGDPLPALGLFGICGLLDAGNTALALKHGQLARTALHRLLNDRIQLLSLGESLKNVVPIQNNIAWGRPGAGEEEIMQAAKVAQADGFIQSTPQGYKTMVAERGMSLSGGQKQRLSIARAIIKNAEILIFDDSTSALDLKTEADLYEALRDANPDSTKIIIAQRIASVQRADRIVVLSGGSIEAVGTHAALMASCKTYRDIYDSQMGEEVHHG